MAFLMNPLDLVKNGLSQVLKQTLDELTFGCNPNVQFQYIEPPRQPGLSTTFCFDIASVVMKGELDTLEAVHGKKKAKKLLKDKLTDLATSLADRTSKLFVTEELKRISIERVEAERGYLNFYFDIGALAKSILVSILSGSVKVGNEFDFRFGVGEPKNERVMVEYSQPNTHKNFHVGHTRNVALGIAVSNILEYAGYKVVRANYIGDIGAHVLKCLWALEKFPDEFQEIDDPGKRLGEYYSLSDKAENNGCVDTRNGRFEISKESFKNDIKQMFARWEAGDPMLVGLWKETRQSSLESFNRIYGLLGAKFDHVFYESDVEFDGKSCVEELIELGVAEVGADGEYEGAVFVDFNKHFPDKDLRKMVIQRADGSSLYQTKELALAKKKFNEFDIDRSIYIVASEQSFYFKQVFAILKLWGFPQADACIHLPYEIVMLPEGKMSSRSGTVVLFDDLLIEALNRLREITREKGYAVDIEDTAMKIAVGAIKFSMLNIDHNKVVVFDWDKALNFGGQAGPYIQYMAVRAKRIIEESRLYSDIKSSANEAVSSLNLLSEPLDSESLTEYEHRLILALGRYPELVRQSAEDLAPYILTRYAYEISQNFGEFYRFCQVLKCDEPVKTYRLSIVIAFYCVLESCMGLLGMEVPSAM
jgi:arginyl-tRNA synthetase